MYSIPPRCYRCYMLQNIQGSWRALLPAGCWLLAARVYLYYFWLYIYIPFSSFEAVGYAVRYSRIIQLDTATARYSYIIYR